MCEIFIQWDEFSAPLQSSPKPVLSHKISQGDKSVKWFGELAAVFHSFRKDHGSRDSCLIQN